MSKGSNPRPFDIPMEKFHQNWDNIFGKKQDKKEDEEDNKKE